jgi:DNA mismatch repair protein MutS2
VDEALANVTRFIDEAMAANLDRVEVVHGKGTGALRQAIHEYLEKSPDVDRFEEAPWDEGGPGVTYVYLR